MSTPTIPIKVNIDVAETVQAFNMAVAEQTTAVSMDVDTQIVVDAGEEYEGPYSVTPSETSQTLETADKVMTNDVSIGAIPSDYVGSGVTRRDSSDLSVSGATVTAPSGHYENASSKSISNATISTSSSVTVNPTLSIDYNTGEITASVSKTQNVNVVTSAGYAPVTSHQVVMTGNVGTQLITRDASDMTASGDTVTAPDGYYPSPASLSVQSGSATTPSLGLEVNPTIAISNSGKITSTVSKSESITPIVSAGYVSSGTAGTVTVSGSNTLQLNTKSATTITPTESVQTAVEQNRWTTGEVKVGAIPSNYVGSGVTQRTSSDLSASGDTVTAPAGYYASSASASVPAATWKSASTIACVPTITVSSSGLITADVSGWTSCYPLSASGYADSSTAANLQEVGTKTSQLDTIGATTYTPNKTAVQEIPAGKFTTGIQTIGTIPEQYYDMSGSMAWLGADATLVHEIDPVTIALKDSAFNTWSPSTTAATVVASVTLSTASQKYTATDLLADDGYDYINVWNMKMPITYTGTPTQKALPLFSCGLLVQAIFRRYSSYANLLIGNLNSNVTAQVTLQSFLRYYGSTTGTITYTNSSSYGFYYANVAPSISSTSAVSPTITLKTPTMSARCSTTYMSTTNAGLVDKTNTKLTYTCKVYRVKHSAYIEGFYKYLAARVAEMDT